MDIESFREETRNLVRKVSEDLSLGPPTVSADDLIEELGYFEAEWEVPSGMRLQIKSSMWVPLRVILLSDDRDLERFAEIMRAEPVPDGNAPSLQDLRRRKAERDNQ